MIDPIEFKENIISRLQYYRQLGAKTMAQLSETELLFVPAGGSNSIAVIVKHLHGNMLSRFTDFLITDGEKPWRNRDTEFEDQGLEGENIPALYETGWDAVIHAIEAMGPDDLNSRITIRSEKLKAYDAILRQLAHYANHVGQIMYIGKMIRGREWDSLSIPTGASQEYNRAKERGELGKDAKA